MDHTASEDGDISIPPFENTSSSTHAAAPLPVIDPRPVESSAMTSGQDKQTITSKFKQTTLTSWTKSLTRVDAKEVALPQPQPTSQPAEPGSPSISTAQAATVPETQPDHQDSPAMSTDKPSKGRGKRHSWFYATVKPVDDSDLPELDTRGTMTLEDQIKLARYQALHGEAESRPKRARPSYAPPPRPPPKPKASKPSIREVPNRTLPESNQQLLDGAISALDMDWTVDQDGNVHIVNEGGDSRPSSKGLGFIGKAGSALASTASILGKRGRELFNVGKDKLKEVAFDDEADVDGRPSKKVKTSEASLLHSPSRRRSARTTSSPLKTARLSVASASTIGIPKDKEKTQNRVPKKKRWEPHGLYIGQEQNFDARLTTESQNKKKAKEDKDQADKQRTLLPLPMFGGRSIMENGRDFRLPFDVFSPLPPGQAKPDEWRKTGSNRFVGDSATEWKKSKALPNSRCLCAPESGCDESCQNRYMLYECDDNNCSIGKEYCTNRAFAGLKERTKSGKKFHIGVEVMKTVDKGFGVRACRTFAPEQIIVEYTGEIITQEECERRMRNEYKDNECYYLMTFDQNMIIDATRGSIARFINHSCEPNCRMIKWTVAGKPRMALFAGDRGIMTGEELTYDYNFDPFSQKNVQNCYCGAETCRGKLGPRGTKQKDNGSGKDKNSIIAKGKRKLNDLIGNDNDSETTPSPKKTKKNPAKLVKRRNTLTGSTATNRLNKALNSRANKRVTSTSSDHTALLDKENIRASSSRSSTASGSSRGRDAEPKKTKSHLRRNSVDALARVGSSLKRSASRLQMSSARMSSRRGKQTQRSVSGFQPLTLALDTDLSLGCDDVEMAAETIIEHEEDETGTTFRSRKRAVVPL